AWSAYHGEVPEGLYVCHSCDNPSCVAIEHLFLGTPGENYRDMRRKGRTRYNAKLDGADLAEIKRRLAQGESAKQIAKDFPVSANQIGKIRSGRAWKEQ
ncbi:MAG: HNH endonuclease, partial [Alphaproteobacteria bacterium]|nr:HNH endonuclease [Alphaproteobacteria bacterium]